MPMMGKTIDIQVLTYLFIFTLCSVSCWIRSYSSIRHCTSRGADATSGKQRRGEGGVDEAPGGLG